MHTHDAGMLGIGGGMVLAPLFLSMRAHPLQASATSNLMILFSASSAALSLGMAGRVNAEFAALLGACGCVSSFVGVTVVAGAVRRSGKARGWVFLFACVFVSARHAFRWAVGLVRLRCSRVGAVSHACDAAPTHACSIHQHTAQASTIVVLLACIIACGAVLTAGVGGQRAVAELRAGRGLALTPLCSAP